MKLSAVLIVCLGCVQYVTSQGGSRYSCANRCGQYRSSSWCSCDLHCGLSSSLPVPHGCCRDYRRHCAVIPPPPPPPHSRRCPRPPSQRNGQFRPVNREYFEGSKVTYECKRGFVASIDDPTSTCRGGEWDPPAVPRCRVPVFQFCGAPSVSDGRISYAVVKHQYIVSEQVTFTCPYGYRLIGSAVLTCVGTHLWEPDAPTCERITCPHVSPPNYGGYTPANKEVWYPRDRVTYNCNRCYTLEGESVARCNDAGDWNYPPPICSPPCQYPELPSYGYITPAKRAPHLPPRCYGNGDFITYYCNEGYRLVGRSRATCQYGGSWSHTPSCVPITCPNRRIPQYGTYLPSRKTSWLIGDVITYSCDRCYSLNGASTARCKPDRTWTNRVPTCRPDCRRPRKPDHGFILPAKRRCFPEKEVIRYRCNRGYQAQGNRFVTCRDGAWSHEPTCRRITCPHKDPPTYGSYAPPDKTTWYPGDEATYSCAPYYSLVGDAVSTCMDNGEWTHDVPVCQLTSPCNNRCTLEYAYDVICQCHPNCGEECCPDVGYCDPCPPLDPPTYGYVNVNGKTATYSCQTDYSLVGDQTRTCNNGAWGSVAPTCEPDEDDDIQPNESCLGRCGMRGGTLEYPCDCDPSCGQYQSCCADYGDHC